MGFAFLLILLAVGVNALLHNGRFHEYVLHKADQIASRQLGAKVTLQNFAVHLSGLSVDLYGISIEGASPFSNPPLLQVQHIGLDFRIVSVWHRKWYFDNIRVDNPVVRIVTDAHGNSNLPQLKTTGNSHTNIFQLGVRHASLHHGELYTNDRAIPLDADLHDVNFSSSFHAEDQKYSGSLSYRNGHLQFGAFNPITHNLTAQFQATPDTFHLTHAEIDSGSSQFQATATLKNYSDPKIQANYTAVLDGATIRNILKNPSIPTGMVATNGSVQYQHAVNVSVLDSLTMNGALTSRRLEVSAQKIRARMQNVSAKYSLQNGNLSVQGAHITLLGGAADGDLAIRNLGGDMHSSLNITLRQISMADVQRLAAPIVTAKDAALRGALNGTVQATWGSTLNDLVVQTKLAIRGNVSSAHAGQNVSNVVPITGDIRGSYSAATQQIQLRNSLLQTPHTSLAMNGAVSQRSSLACAFPIK